MIGKKQRGRAVSVEKMLALSAVGRLDGMVYEIMNTRHELVMTLQQAQSVGLREDTVGSVVDIVV